jgi:hypothetical protein
VISFLHICQSEFESYAHTKTYIPQTGNNPKVFNWWMNRWTNTFINRILLSYQKQCTTDIFSDMDEAQMDILNKRRQSKMFHNV